MNILAICNSLGIHYVFFVDGKQFARVAELVDALDLGSSILTDVGVRVPPLVHETVIHCRAIN